MNFCMPGLKWEAVARGIFDLDGTLVDSEGEAADADELALRYWAVNPRSPTRLCRQVTPRRYPWWYIRNNGARARRALLETVFRAGWFFQAAKTVPASAQSPRDGPLVTARKPCALVPARRAAGRLVLGALDIKGCFKGNGVRRRVCLRKTEITESAAGERRCLGVRSPTAGV